jgi:hypothetical protein
MSFYIFYFKSIKIYFKIVLEINYFFYFRFYLFNQTYIFFYVFVPSVLSSNKRNIKIVSLILRCFKAKQVGEIRFERLKNGGSIHERIGLVLKAKQCVSFQAQSLLSLSYFFYQFNYNFLFNLIG